MTYLLEMLLFMIPIHVMEHEATSKAWIHGTVVDILLKHGYMELSIIHVMEHEDTSIHVMFR
jgi:hypothetical protein